MALTADLIFINTGTRPARPPLAGLDFERPPFRNLGSGLPSGGRCHGLLEPASASVYLGTAAPASSETTTGYRSRPTCLGTYRMHRLGFKPLRDELSANMDVYLPERSLTRIDKFVRRTGWHNHNLHGLDLKSGRADHIRGSAFQYNKDLFVGMRMQAGSTSGWHINQYERNIGMLV
jgi:hypothetical protein